MIKKSISTVVTFRNVTFEVRTLEEKTAGLHVRLKSAVDLMCQQIGSRTERLFNLISLEHQQRFMSNYRQSAPITFGGATRLAPPSRVLITDVFGSAATPRHTVYYDMPQSNCTTIVYVSDDIHGLDITEIAATIMASVERECDANFELTLPVAQSKLEARIVELRSGARQSTELWRFARAHVGSYRNSVVPQDLTGSRDSFAGLRPVDSVEFPDEGLLLLAATGGLFPEIEFVGEVVCIKVWETKSGGGDDDGELVHVNFWRDSATTKPMTAAKHVPVCFHAITVMNQIASAGKHMEFYRGDTVVEIMYPTGLLDMLNFANSGWVDIVDVPSVESCDKNFAVGLTNITAHAMPIFVPFRKLRVTGTDFALGMYAVMIDFLRCATNNGWLVSAMACHFSRALLSVLHDSGCSVRIDDDDAINAITLSASSPSNAALVANTYYSMGGDRSFTTCLPVAKRLRGLPEIDNQATIKPRVARNGDEFIRYWSTLT